MNTCNFDKGNSGRNEKARCNGRVFNLHVFLWAILMCINCRTDSRSKWAFDIGCSIRLSIWARLVPGPPAFNAARSKTDTEREREPHLVQREREREREKKKETEATPHHSPGEREREREGRSTVQGLPVLHVSKAKTKREREPSAGVGELLLCVA